MKSMWRALRNLRMMLVLLLVMVIKLVVVVVVVVVVILLVLLSSTQGGTGTGGTATDISLMDEEQYVEHCRKSMEQMGMPFDEAMVRQHYKNIRDNYQQAQGGEAAAAAGEGEGGGGTPGRSAQLTN